jgi:hypothetical protein
MSNTSRVTSWSLWKDIELEDEIVGPPKALSSCAGVFPPRKKEYSSLKVPSFHQTPPSPQKP